MVQCVVQWIFLLVSCILTRSTGSPKYGVTRKNIPRYYSLRSKLFQSSYCAKVRAGAEKKGRRKGRGEEETLARKPLDFCKTPLDISRFRSFVNLQLVKIEASIIARVAGVSTSSRAPILFHPKPPFPSFSNACHAGYQ